MDYDRPVTRTEDAAHWRRWRRNAVIGYAIMLIGFGVGGAIQAKSAADAHNDTNDAAKQFCERLNRTSATVAAALMQQKKLSQKKYEDGLTPKAEWVKQQAALDKAITGLAPADCSAIHLT